MKGIGAVIMAIIMTPVELIGKIVKPFALTSAAVREHDRGALRHPGAARLDLRVRYRPAVQSAASSWADRWALTLFMMFLELLVAFLQAYIFALLTSVFIGLMRHEH